MLVALPLLAVVWVRWVARAVTGRPRAGLARPSLLWALLVLVLAFGAARNLPGAVWLAP